MNYRNIAKSHLKLAEEELRSSNVQRLKYAALELRMSMEAITYDRALAYKDEFPPQEYEAWQPKKVLKVLLEIDAMADESSSISVGLQTLPDSLPETMQSLGSESVFNLKMMKKHYDALGSYLHIISMKQSRNGKVQDMNKLRKRCEEIFRFLDLALSSPVFNIKLGNFARLNCQECSHQIRKRIPFSKSDLPLVAKCFNCKATYTLSDAGNGQIEWELNQRSLKCANSDCQKEIIILEHELAVGLNWVCNDCKGNNIITLGIQHQYPNKP